MPDVRILQKPDLEFSDIAKLTEFHIIVLEHGLTGTRPPLDPAAACDGTVNVPQNKFVSRLFYRQSQCIDDEIRSTTELQNCSTLAQAKEKMKGRLTFKLVATTKHHHYQIFPSRNYQVIKMERRNFKIVKNCLFDLYES